MELDSIDIELLKALQEKGNFTTKELAERVNLSPTPVYERVKKLEKSGFIKKYVAVLDREKLAKDLIVFCHVTLVKHTKEIGMKFVQDIVSLKEVTECYNTSGDYDFLLKVVVKDMKHYQEFVIHSLGSIENIGSAHSTFVMGEIKQTYSIPL